MSWIAARMARTLWAAMLWLMRRRWMRRLQRASIAWAREGASRERAWAVYRRQERFARKYGLRVLTWVFTLCLYSLLFLVLYEALARVLDEGWLAVPSQPPR